MFHARILLLFISFSAVYGKRRIAKAKCVNLSHNQYIYEEAKTFVMNARLGSMLQKAVVRLNVIVFNA